MYNSKNSAVGKVKLTIPLLPQSKLLGITAASHNLRTRLKFNYLILWIDKSHNFLGISLHKDMIYNLGLFSSK